MSSPASLPVEIHLSAERGELQKVVKWLSKGGQGDAFGSAETDDGRATDATLLQIAAGCGHLEIPQAQPYTSCGHGTLSTLPLLARKKPDGRRGASGGRVRT